MGITSWLMERGALGGIARSSARTFIKCRRDDPKQAIATYLANVALLRYALLGQRHNVSLSLVKLHRRTLDNEAPLGLLSLCYVFASIEMDIQGIERDVMNVLKKVLLKENLFSNEIFGDNDPEQFSEYFFEIMGTE